LTNLTQEKIESILSTVIDVHTNKDLVSSDNVKNISIDDEIVNVELLLKYPALNYLENCKTLSKKPSLKPVLAIHLSLLNQK